MFRVRLIWLLIGALLCAPLYGAKRRAAGRATSTTQVAAAPPSQPVAPPPAPAVAVPQVPAPAKLELTLDSPANGAEFSTPEILMRVTVRVPPGDALLGLRALVDGRVAARTRSGVLTSLPPEATGAGQQLHMTVPVPAQDCTVSVIAEGAQFKSAPVQARLHFTGQALDQAKDPRLQPKLYVLSIGVSDYQQPELRLRFAAKDARDLAAVFHSQQKLLYRAVEARVLTDKQASKGNILDGLQWLREQTTAKDVAVVMLAGHGVTDPASGIYYFLPYEADQNAMMRTMLPETDLRTALANIAGKVLLFLDTCHSGKVFGAKQSRGLEDLGPFISELASADNGVIVFAASTGKQASQEAAEWSNGAFTRAVAEGLRGRADFHHTGRITVNMLDLYISERVKELTGGKQTPTTAKPATISDFPISVVQDVGNDDIDVVR